MDTTQIKSLNFALYDSVKTDIEKVIEKHNLYGYQACAILDTIVKAQIISNLVANAPNLDAAIKSMRDSNNAILEESIELLKKTYNKRS
jgi:hypothetical protein